MLLKKSAESSEAATDASSRSDSMQLVVAAVLVGLTALWLFAPSQHRWPQQFGGPTWTIAPQTAHWPAGFWALPLGVLLLFGGLAAWSAYDRFQRAKTAKEQHASILLCLFALTVLAASWPWSLLGGPDGARVLLASTWSDVANQYFGASYQIENPREFSRNYPQFQTPPSNLEAHVATHPPGATLFYFGARRIYENVPMVQSASESLALSLTSETGGIASLSAFAGNLRETSGRSAGVGSTASLPASAVGAAFWCAFLLSVCVGLTAPAVYLLARGEDENGGEARGLCGAVMWALLPAAGLFAFTLDALVAFLAAWSLVGLTRRGAAAKLAGGAILAVASWVSFGALAIGATSLLFLMLQQRRNWRAMGRDLIFIGVGFGVMWLLILLIFPTPLPEVWSRAMETHHQVTLAGRARLPWMWWNVLMFAPFLGWPVVVATASALRRDQKNAAFNVGLATLSTMLLLTLSGSVRGEVERLWLFLAPGLCVLAASRLENVRVWAALLGLQAVQTLAMAATLAPLIRPF